MYHLVFLLLFGVVSLVHGAAKIPGANQTVIKLDKSRFNGLICNDEKTRFSLNITLSDHGKNATSYRLKFCHERGGVQACPPGYIALVDFDTSMPFYYFRFTVNSYYNYRFKLFEIEQDLAEQEERAQVCENLYDTNHRFGQCDEYTLQIGQLDKSTTCSLLLVKPTPTSKGYIKYFYIATMALLGLFVLFKSVQVLFFRYKLLNN